MIVQFVLVGDIEIALVIKIAVFFQESFIWVFLLV